MNYILKIQIFFFKSNIALAKHTLYDFLNKYYFYHAKSNAI